MAYCRAGKSDRSATLTNTPEVLETMNKIDPAEVDYYYIGYGTNDFINNVKLDTSTYDTDGEQAHAFFNAMCKGIDVLAEISPNAQFIIITPFYGIYVTDDGAYVGDSYIVSNGTGTLAEYARKAMNVAEEKKLYYFDGMFISKCDLYLDTADAYLSDHLHLNKTGRQIMGRLLAHYVNYLEKNEPYAYLETDFIKIAEFNPDEDYRCDENLMKSNYPESWAKYIKGEFPLAQPSEEALEEYREESSKKEESKTDDNAENKDD
jgi:lysophospholipase L1-like esterase